MHILLIDDDVSLSGMLGEYLEGEGFQISIRNSGQAGLDTLKSESIDLVVLDIMMPAMDGMTVLRHIRQQSEVPVIMLTARGDNIDRVVGLEMGADDYLSKPCYPRELSARIKAILRRSSSKSSTDDELNLSLGYLSLEQEKRIASWKKQPIELTATEFNLLGALLIADGNVVSKSDLSESALGKPMGPYDRSIDVHISHLRQKLSLLPDFNLQISTVRGIGYRLST